MARPKRRSASSSLSAAAVAAAVAAACLLAAAALPRAAAACVQNVGPAANADDKVTTWSRPCDQGNNADCPACKLWDIAQRNKQNPGDKYAYSQTFVDNGKIANYRAKILPTTALQGIESIAGKSPASDKPTYDMWSTALSAAIAGKMGNTGVAGTNHPVAVINSLNARSQHHMHVHVGKPKSDAFFNCANKKNWIKKPPTLKTWDNIPADICNDLSYAKKTVTLLATTAKAAGVNDAIRAGFKKVNTKTHDITTDPAGQRTAVLVQPTSTSGVYLVVLITGSGVNDYSIFGDSP
jgi:hypothetical protein